MEPGIRDRARGTLLGLAVGDALGAAVEFQPPGTFEKVVGHHGGAPWGIPAGAWTDDTSMALALADSVAKAGWDLDDQMRRYVRWWRDGAYSVIDRCFDIGGTTASALTQFIRRPDARSAASTSERSAGNGCIMRLAPVPVRFHPLFPDQLEEVCRYARESSLTTHAAPQCVSASEGLTVILAGLIHGLDRRTVLDPSWPPMVELRRIRPPHREVAAVWDGSFRVKDPPEIRAGGYVVACLEAALWAFDRESDFRSAVLAAVNLGNDSDTVGAVCGQLAGARWGESGIPNDLLDGLVRREMIETALDGLLEY